MSAGVTAALVVATSPGALATVAGLPLVVRAVLTLRAAGFTDIAVFAGPQTRRVGTLLADRCSGVPCLGAPDDVAGFLWPDPVLVVPADVLFEPTALVPLLATAEDPGVRAATPSASGDVAVAICPAARIAPLLTELSRWAGLRIETLRRVGLVDEAPVPLGPGLFVPLDSAHPPAALEAALLEHLGRHTAATDGYLTALIDRRLSRPLTRWLLGWPVPPSWITLASILVGLVGAAGLTTVSYWGRVAGTLALIGSQVLDAVDGEVARARVEQSAAGARLDVIGDYVVNLAVFVGLGIGLGRQGLPASGWWVVIALVLGVVAAMAAVHVLFIRPAITRGGDLHWPGDGESLRGAAPARIAEKLASRDYTYLLLAFAVVGHLEWFLYAAAGGAWLFVVALLGYWGYRHRHLSRIPRLSPSRGAVPAVGEEAPAGPAPPVGAAPAEFQAAADQDPLAGAGPVEPLGEPRPPTDDP